MFFSIFVQLSWYSRYLRCAALFGERRREDGFKLFAREGFHFKEFLRDGIQFAAVFGQ